MLARLGARVAAIVKAIGCMRWAVERTSKGGAGIRTTRAFTCSSQTNACRGKGQLPLRAITLAISAVERTPGSRSRG